ncbi:hypothetical protein M427DRAFT_63633 [Gonapodya prolifera JEL478]|uniref:Uncharacterized protein n=1 Tax=Gonapodya prolifera (strain JEL478) TaxID=1344416 RepID=A0A138ZYZ1_GONPJ|nr:hypothetical protein M427DRAFT_63633 [Gonapodya prolifera JEL478]|eukprot:KXS09732.1 hypothetical protein M427DRAFT_63633 [Gonapodya prolifera JEL478]
MSRDAHLSSLWTPDSDPTKVCLLNKSEDSDSLLTHVTLNSPPSIAGVPLPPPPAFVEVFCGHDGTTFRPSSVSVISNCRKQELYFGGEYRALLEGESLSTTLQGLVDAEDVEVVKYVAGSMGSEFQRR